MVDFNKELTKLREFRQLFNDFCTYLYENNLASPQDISLIKSEELLFRKAKEQKTIIPVILGYDVNYALDFHENLLHWFKWLRENSNNGL